MSSTPFPAVATVPLRASPADAEHFAAPICRNCMAAMATRFCAACGQEKTRRLNLLSVGGEVWQNFRLFEFSVVKAAWRLLNTPGLVARAYVLGARKQHVHPLKLLLVAIGLLLLVLGRSQALASQDARVSEAMTIVQAYANWSFSIGIVAIVLASAAVFMWRQPYNLTEHLVLGVYVHFLVIVASVINLLPTLVFRDPHWLALHKAWSSGPMSAVEALIVMRAYAQFFDTSWRRSTARLLLAGLVFVAVKWLLLRLYAIVLVKLVLARLH